MTTLEKRSIRFTKMQGVGNDFMVVDATTTPFDLTPEQCQQLANRHFGVGFDQLLIVEKTTVPGADFKYRIVNADGAEVQHCGNGARCFVVFVRDRALTRKKRIKVETLSGILDLKLEDDGNVTVEMGVPRLEAAQVPFLPAGLRAKRVKNAQLWHIELPECARTITAVSMGNPHAVQIVADVDAAPVAAEGPLIERHMRFPERVNAGFMQIVDRHTLRLRVYERGAGETLACGTGACAAVVAGVLQGQLASPVNVQMRGGSIGVAWGGEGTTVVVTGPAVKVFDGQVLV
jgi:diaminopimelate epimerase